MSINSINYHSFYKDVVKNKLVYTIKDESGFPAPVSENGKRAMPFWSSKKRAMNIISNSKNYSKFQIEQIPLNLFLKNWLTGLIKDDLMIGINWSGEKATGFDLNPKDVLYNFNELLKQKT
ncbi:DUF2750 domain-containing protein [Leptospira kanakyensis]|uniref:DUF2750 domain-containing protein n=1 Tax=Leptospira kanakyensis TaxID=2484968 RepID=UPI00223D44D6|nr:DUF2750 domain-containing protein [Leptospira kanakyensis]MCW7471831.1 DUF2750 domain-containing protein [Leptospira kanakyensis]